MVHPGRRGALHGRSRGPGTLKDDRGIPDGLAADSVDVLDPCCGTGAYLAEVLRRIAANLEGRSLGALAGARVEQAALNRVFGFEIMPAPFVVAHLQVRLTLQDLDVPLADEGDERAGVFLTNALTGWKPRTTKPLPFPKLEEERDRAGGIWRRLMRFGLIASTATSTRPAGLRRTGDRPRASFRHQKVWAVSKLAPPSRP